MLTRRTLLRVGVMTFLGWSRPARAAEPLQLTRANSSDVLLIPPRVWYPGDGLDTVLDTSFEVEAEDLNYIFRDRRTNQEVDIDPALVGILQCLQGHLGCSKIELLSGYRTPASNRAAGGALHSYHMQGQAMDIRIPGVSPAEVAIAAQSLGVPGVGRYPDFTHLDTGPERTWDGGKRRGRRRLSHRA